MITNDGYGHVHVETQSPNMPRAESRIDPENPMAEVI